jgi:hypothetical protein
MATSTEDTIRAAVVSALQGIYTTLGFDDENGNVKSYLLDYERAEAITNYLTASVGYKRVVRAWGVQVLGDDKFEAIGYITRRTYRIEIVGYYDIGTSGSGVNALISGARAVRGALKDMGSTLGGRIDHIIGTDLLDISKLRGVDPSIGEILTGRLVFTGEKQNPDF